MVRSIKHRCRAPRIQVEQFAPFISITPAEKALYDMVAQWAGRDSRMQSELAREVPKLIAQVKEGGTKSVANKAVKKLLVFAADKIELEWPEDRNALLHRLETLLGETQADPNASADLSECLKSSYFFS